MKIYVYLDESGSIHKNSKTRYFAVGGYFTFKEDRLKIISNYKRINLELKRSKNISLENEIKSYDMSQKEKIKIFSTIQKIKTFKGCIKVFDKKIMRKEIVESNIFFNYAVKLLLQDCIIKELTKKKIKDNLEFIISIDNRNIKVGELRDLETYLNTEFCLDNYIFKVKYFDSKTNFGIQLADLIVNTFYNYYKDRRIVRYVIPILKREKYNLSLFSGNCNKKQKSKYNIIENN